MLPQMDVSAGGTHTSTTPRSWCSINVHLCPQGVSLDIALACVAPGGFCLIEVCLTEVLLDISVIA